MTLTLDIELGNNAPKFGDTHIAPFVDLWREADAYFSTVSSAPFFVDQDPDRGYEFRLAAQDTLEFLAAINSLGVDANALEARWKAREQNGRHMLTSDIELRITPVGGSADAVQDAVVSRFLQQLFLAFNLAVPGSMSLSNSRCHGGLPRATLPQLVPDLFEAAAARAAELRWPPLKQLTFKQAWTWLQTNLLHDTFLAEKPHEKAAFALLRCAEPKLHDPDVILLVAQSLEALMHCGKDNIANTLRERLEAVLGVPSQGGKGFGKFYDLRSRIAHGDRPTIRPGDCYPDDDPQIEKYFADYFRPVEFGIAILMAVIQDLIATAARDYMFAQKVDRVRHPWLGAT